MKKKTKCGCPSNNIKPLHCTNEEDLQTYNRDSKTLTLCWECTLTGDVEVKPEPSLEERVAKLEKQFEDQNKVEVLKSKTGLNPTATEIHMKLRDKPKKTKKIDLEKELSEVFYTTHKHGEYIKKLKALFKKYHKQLNEEGK